MRHEIIHILLPNTPLKHLVLHWRALAEVCLENQPQPLDRSEISELPAIPHACGVDLTTCTATRQKFPQQLSNQARNVR